MEVDPDGLRPAAGRFRRGENLRAWVQHRPLGHVVAVCALDPAGIAADQFVVNGTVIDIASLRVVGWATADHLRTELVAEALTAACRQRRPTHSVIFHSDRGCQYTSQQFAVLAAQFEVRLSVGRTGQCWDNALAESFFSTIKRELLGTSAWPSRATARTAIFDFIEGWYNLHRLHSSLGYLSPAEYETALAA
ncbi:IS3 family transposase [Streptomyces sp. NPDC048430]|uniref:IS3 family transposase n=1 Tax=Streptomyces sp. NPDC048430 TaxID=3155388 RepID=UPI00342D8D6F